MPASQADLAAAQAFRAAQLTLQARFLRESLALWPVLDKGRIGSTSPAWLRAQVGLIRRWRRDSATAASRYYRTVGHVAAPRVPDLPDVQVAKSLSVTGPGRFLRLVERGMDPEQASSAALAASGRSGARLVLSGARETVTAAVKADPKALGWMRVTDDDPCAFCAMLASRAVGPNAVLYRDQGTAGADANDRFVGEGLFKFHDGCGCQVVPVFVRKPVLAESSQRFSDLWGNSTGGLHGVDAINAFRRAHEGRSLPDDPINRQRKAA